MAFQKAVREKAKLRLAIDGPSGSGKTYSALRIATGMGGKIALIDTEEESSKFYADKFDFDANFFSSPYSVEKYISAIEEADKNGYDVLIIDSFTHAWDGPGGLLDVVDKKARTMKGNSYAAWKSATPMYKKLIDAVLKSGLHIIVTMRTKTAYETSTDDSNKMRVQKIGTKPIQREGTEYEFTIVFDITVPDHLATCDKDRTGLFDGAVPFVPSEETGKALAEYLASGKEPAPREPSPDERFDDVLSFVREQITAENATKDDWKDVFNSVMGDKRKVTSNEEVDKLMDAFSLLLEQQHTAKTGEQE